MTELEEVSPKRRAQFDRYLEARELILRAFVAGLIAAFFLRWIGGAFT